MRRTVLWKLSVRTTPEAEDDVRNFLADAFGESPVSYTDFESGETTVSLYLARKPEGDQSQRRELGVQLRQIVGRARSPLRAANRAQPARARELRRAPAPGGLRTVPPRIAIEKVRWQDWAESWKRHFRPIEIGPSLLIRPSWSRRRARKGQATIVLDPGLSFGTGQHPTTAFCLEQLASQRARGHLQSLLDLGTGSGILAIAAAKLGYSRITAIDYDSGAVLIARANASKNRVVRKIRFRHQDVAKLPRRPAKTYSLVCANLLASLLLDERRRILAQLEDNGILIVAGILKTEFSQLQKAYESEGLRLIASRVGNEWRSGAFARKRDTRSAV